jgi:excisionase family DNA binding protein
VTARKRNLSSEEIEQAFAGKAGEEFPVILSPATLAALLRLSPKTIYEWIARGRLDGAFRKRGKHVLIWRDRAIELLFNGPEWRNHGRSE